MSEGFREIIAGLERQRAAIEKALAALRELDGYTAAPAPARPVAAAERTAPARKKSAAPAPRRGQISAEGRKRLADAMKLRWAVKRSGATAKKAAKKKPA